MFINSYYFLCFTIVSGLSVSLYGMEHDNVSFVGTENRSSQADDNLQTIIRAFELFDWPDCAIKLFQGEADEAKKCVIRDIIFFTAVRNGHLRTVEALLKLGAQANGCDEFGNSAVKLAEQSGNSEVMVLLANSLAAGDSGEHTQSSDSCPVTPIATHPGQSMLDLSSLKLSELDRKALEFFDWPNTVRFLIENEKCLYRKKILTLFIFFTAASNGHIETVKFLLLAGLDGNIADDNGDTVLHKAAGGGHYELVKLLLCSGVRASEINYNGQTPLELSLARGRGTEINQLLRSSGALTSEELAREMTDLTTRKLRLPLLPPITVDLTEQLDLLDEVIDVIEVFEASNASEPIASSREQDLGNAYIYVD